MVSVPIQNMSKIDNLVLVVRKSLVAMEKYWLLWQLVCDKLVCMVAVYNLASVPIQNMSKVDNQFMVAKEIAGCHGENWLPWILIC